MLEYTWIVGDQVSGVWFQVLDDRLLGDGDAPPGGWGGLKLTNVLAISGAAKPRPSASSCCCIALRIRPSHLATQVVFTVHPVIESRIDQESQFVDISRNPIPIRALAFGDTSTNPIFL